MQVIDTPVGRLLAKWTASGLYSCEFCKQENEILQAEHSIVHNSIGQESADDQLPARFAQQVADYFETGVFQWDLQSLDWTGVSPFHRQVLEVCYEIPAGDVKTYGAVAELAGSPKAARAVGGAMARNRWPILIPCHRVVGAGGSLTGYSGLGGIATKQRLLEMERELLGTRPLCTT